MLAQNFKSAADLEITEPQKDALMKTLVLLETGKLQHAKSGHASSRKRAFSGQFNMASWSAEGDCGTVCCIGGTAELIGNVMFGDIGSHGITPALNDLFYVHPSHPRVKNWRDITPSEAATALRSYLTTGEARWDLALASAPEVYDDR